MQEYRPTTKKTLTAIIKIDFIITFPIYKFINMNRYSFSVFLFFLFALVGYAHKINAYKYIVISQQGNTYGIEDKLESAFTKVGFQVILEGDDNYISDDEKTLVLYASYSPIIHNGYASELIVILRDGAGTEIYKSVTTGNSMTASGDMSKAINKLLSNMQKLNYSFDNTKLIQKTTGEIECSTWSEDSIKSYLKNKSASSIEGIYKNFSNDGQFYRFAIIKQKDKFYGVILESGNKNWKQGDIKLSMTYIDKNTYDTEYYSYNKSKLNCLASYNNRILEIASDNGNFQFLKIYPSASSSSDNSTGNSPSDCKATGSGILISDKFIVTNYHVIDDAERIEVAFYNNGSVESYNAKTLIVDKTNDLAIIVIKDAKFNALPDAPFNILNNTIDVGSSVFTMGYPMAQVMGDEIKVTDGIVSAKSGYEGDVSTYQISAPIQPGNSGGALFDKKGNLVGITNAGILSAENVGYAIKTSYLYNLIDSSPVEIKIPSGNNNSKEDLPSLIKKFKPYVAIIKIF